jgi:hypothetical protein
MSLVDVRRQVVLAAQWTRSPTNYPFYHAFVEGLLYAHWNAAVEHNKLSTEMLKPIANNSLIFFSPDEEAIQPVIRLI